MTYDDIIAEIKSNLTGNADKDKAYLIKQFKMHNLKEIHLELGRLLWDLMSDEEQKEYKKAVIQDIPVDEFIKSVYSYLNYGDFETTLKELEDYMEILPFKFMEDSQFDYFYFNNPLEEELFRKYFKTPKELKVIPFGEEYHYENHPRAQIELQLINSYLYIDETDIKKVLNDENIPANINDDILEISMFLALDFEKKNLLNQSLYFYGVLYNLTHDEEVLTKINDLKHRL